MNFASLKLSGAFLLVALCACSTTHPQENSNTNWLRRCSAKSDCGSRELCACGVCTIACTENAMCRNDDAPDAVCASVADLRCASPAKGAVCTASCERDEDCAGGELSCVAGTCVDPNALAGRPGRDAAVDRDDAGGLRDSGESDAAIEPSCEERRGCGEDTACYLDGCRPLWSGAGCEPAAEIRSSCTSDDNCGQGFVCHVDGTCIEPGKCDRFGVTTLATLGDIGAMAVTENSVFVLDRGSEDALGNHRGDGAIREIAIADGSHRTIIEGLDRPVDMKVDAQRLYWQSSSNTLIGMEWADRADGANRGKVSMPATFFSWVQNETHTYAMFVDMADRFHLFRIAKGSASPEQLDAEPWLLRNYGMNIDSSFVYFNGTQRWSLAGEAALDSTVVVADPSFIDGRYIYFTESADSDSVGYMAKDGSEKVALAKIPHDSDAAVYWLKAFHDHLYFLRRGPLDDPRHEIDSIMMRVPIASGETETVANLGVRSHLVDVGDRGLFWIQDRRLMRQVIEDYASGASPAQGADGGPCFGDLACDEGLSCIDAFCTTTPPPQTCEQRLGCAADSACLNEHCQRLWTGGGCEPAAGTRPTCDTDSDCEPGSLCHIDGTCIAIGACDRFGMTTLAHVGNVNSLILTKDAAFVADYGTKDALGNYNADGAIVRVSLADGSTQAVASGLSRPGRMLVDAERVYWLEGAGRFSLRTALRAGGESPVELAVGHTNFTWTQDRTHLYFVTADEAQSYELYRAAKNGTAAEQLTHEAWASGFYDVGVDGQYVYMSDGPSGLRWSLQDMTLGPATFPVPAGVYDRDNVYFVDPSAGVHALVSVRRSDAKITKLNDVATVSWYQPYRGSMYLVNQPDEIAMNVQRAPLTPGTAETLLEGIPVDADVFGTAVSDRGLFWIQGRRLLRLVIEDFGANAGPTQGSSGGPCYGDLACDDGLTCVQGLCE